MNFEKITYIAATDARGKEQKFGIKAIDRAKHMYVIGKTGMGKSTLLENMAIQDIQNGEGIAFIDPHGSTAEKLLDYVPEHRIKDVIYFAPFDMDYPVAFNVMEDIGYDKRHLVVSGLMGAFKKIWADQWSARMEYILNNALLALLEYPNSTLLDINKMFINKAFRKKVVDYVTDPLVKSFWNEEFAGYSDRYAQDATPAIQNKVGQFTSNPLIRNIVGQSRSSFDMREIMDNKKIFIANLSKGRMGETNADLIGSMLTTKIYISAMSRADETSIVQTKLPAFYFYVDEFQSIANDSFADILSEARKYKLALTIAHQYVEQMEENVRNAVFGNVGTTIAFRVGPFDAEVLETVFKPKFFAEDLMSLGFAQIYLTLMIDGVGSSPFSAKTLPPIIEPEVMFTQRILEDSRNTYGRPRKQVEDIIKKRNELEGISQHTQKNQDNKVKQNTSQKNSSHQQHKVEQKVEQRGEQRNEQRNESKNRDNSPPRKEKQTVSLNALKFKQYHDNKGPSVEQKSLLREAFQSIQKSTEKHVEEKPKPVSQLKHKPQIEKPISEEKPEQKETIKEVPRKVLESILKDDKDDKLRNK